MHLLSKLWDILLEQLDLLKIILRCNCFDSLEAESVIDRHSCLCSLLPMLIVIAGGASYDSWIYLIRWEVLLRQLLVLLEQEILNDLQAHE